MTRPGYSITRNTFAAISARIFFAQVGLAILVFTLFVLWLRMPDSNVFSVVATVLIGLCLLALVSGGEIAIILRLSNRPLTFSKLSRGSIALVVCVVLWLLWSWILSTLEAKDTLLAGYLNSRFPASLRNIFSYAHLHQAMEWTASMLRWIAAGFLLALVYAAAASTRLRQSMRHILLSAMYWVVLVAGCLIAAELTSKVMNWTPGHGLGVETFSLILRLGIVIIVDTAIALFLLSVISACIQRNDLSYETPAGGPDDSQPLTTVKP